MMENGYQFTYDVKTKCEEYDFNKGITEKLIPAYYSFNKFLYFVKSRLRVVVKVNKAPACFNGTVILTAYIAHIGILVAVYYRAADVLRFVEKREHVTVEFCLTFGRVRVAGNFRYARHFTVNVILYIAFENNAEIA